MSCATEDIKINLGLNICDTPLAKGIGETVLIGRFAWLATSTVDSTNKKIIRTMTLKSGKKLLQYIGQDYSNQATTAFSRGEYGAQVEQSLRYLLFSNDADDETEIDALLGMNDVFAIVHKNGNPGAYKVYGWKTGLKVTGGGNDTNDDTLKGAYTITLSTPDEKTLPYTFQNLTSAVDTSDTYLAALSLAIA